MPSSWGPQTKGKYSYPTYVLLCALCCVSSAAVPWFTNQNVQMILLSLYLYYHLPKLFE